MTTDPSVTTSPEFTPVILAGGSGTRFWPRNRRSRAKQVLALNGERTMIQQTVDRLLALTPMRSVWVVANDGVADAIRTQLPTLAEGHLLKEPVARNTAPACGLAAFLAVRDNPDTVLGFFPSDHVIRDHEAFHVVLRKGIALAKQGANIVALGITPTHPETGYGYIELGSESEQNSASARPIHSFTEKPEMETARTMVQSGRYAWNSGMFLMTARTACEAMYEHAPHIAAPLEAIADTRGTPQFAATLAALYPSCQNISIDYAILEPRSRKGARSGMYCLPANFGWNDLGSWSALHQHRRACELGDVHANVVEGTAASTIHAQGNYVYAPGKHVALLGVQNLVVVLTDDAVLVTTQDRAQEVGSVVRHLSEAGQTQLI